MECVSIAIVERWDGFAIGRGEDGCAVLAGNVWEVLGECWLCHLSVMFIAGGSCVRSYNCSRYWVCEACHAKEFAN